MKRTARNFKMDIAHEEPPEVSEVFDWYRENFGFVTNLAKVQSAAPAVLRAYWLTQKALMEYGVLTSEEHNIIQMTIAVENQCAYCSTGHQMAGDLFFGSDATDLLAIREGQSVSNPRFESLRSFALEVYRNKGRVSDEVLETFYAAGYTQEHALEVITNIGVKVMSNLTNQLALTEIDTAMAPYMRQIAQ